MQTSQSSDHQSNQSGFAVIEAVLVLVVLAIVCFTGYYVWHSREDTNKVLGQTEKVNTKTDTKPAKVTTQQLIQYTHQASALVESAYNAFGASMVKNNNVSKSISDIHPYLSDSLYVSLVEDSTASDPVYCTNDLSVPDKVEAVSVIPSSTVIGVQVDTNRSDHQLITVNVDHRLNKIISIKCPS